jgi:hypothetical protein
MVFPFLDLYFTRSAAQNPAIEGEINEHGSGRLD